jgi:hypothetical protein
MASAVTAYLLDRSVIVVGPERGLVETLPTRLITSPNARSVCSGEMIFSIVSQSGSH